MQRMATATTAELFELQASRRVLFVLGRDVIAFFAFRALQNNVISRHKTSLPDYPVSRFQIPESKI